MTIAGLIHAIYVVGKYSSRQEYVNDCERQSQIPSTFLPYHHHRATKHRDKIGAQNAALCSQYITRT